jgi:lipopolysaccharide/colanic/teichoic acid biosynthesis glycosyltransferase
MLVVPGCREKRLTRAFDVGISSALLLITLPVIAFTAILVCLESPGPVFERQRRIGKSGRPFALLRFRTLSIAPEPHRATEKPARYTRVGAVIHRLHIDELPQLLNILRGEISFVGPRPSDARLPNATPVHKRREHRFTQRRCQPDRRGTVRWHPNGGDPGRRKEDSWKMLRSALSRSF